MSAAGETSGDSLRGCRTLITGGGSGIGLAIARRFDAMGVELILVGREGRCAHPSASAAIVARHRVVGLDAIARRRALRASARRTASPAALIR